MALKVLPQGLATDPERRARFEREAQALAALNHPNIAAIFGLEDSTDQMALIMELCDRICVLDQGRTLAEGTPAEIRSNLDVAAAYLGETPVAEE